MFLPIAVVLFQTSLQLLADNALTMSVEHPKGHVACKLSAAKSDEQQAKTVVCCVTCTDLSQSQLETVIPRDGATHVMIVSGKHRSQVCIH